MAHRLQFRRDTRARWLEINPVLMEGEIGFETDTHNGKVGDGVSTYSELEYNNTITFESIAQILGQSTTLVPSQKLLTDNVNRFDETIENIKQVQRTFSEELNKKLYKEEAKDIYITYEDAEAEHESRLEAEQELRYAISTNRTERIEADEAITSELESIKKAIAELEKSVVKSDSVRTIQTVSESEYQHLVDTESRESTVCYLIKEEQNDANS